MNRIEELFTQYQLKEFKRTYLIVDATIRNLRLSEKHQKILQIEIQEKHPEKESMEKMYGLRNLISHEYFGVDYK
ncbi:MAG: HepT-like ribonuclease domain-containing protein [Bacteroidota bacterium]|nr:HepT-like ribonuclease domain-containing protein [Bacteroidota bacterium]